MTQIVSAREATALPLPWEGGKSPRPRFALRVQYAPALAGLSGKPPHRLRARSVRDAAQTIAAPDKLAKILGRPQQLADNWLPVPIPDDLALAYGGCVHLSHRAGAACAPASDPFSWGAGVERHAVIKGCAGRSMNGGFRATRPSLRGRAWRASREIWVSAFSRACVKTPENSEKRVANSILGTLLPFLAEKNSL